MRHRSAATMLRLWQRMPPHKLWPSSHDSRQFNLQLQAHRARGIDSQERLSSRLAASSLQRPGSRQNARRMATAACRAGSARWQQRWSGAAPACALTQCPCAGGSLMGPCSSGAGGARTWLCRLRQPLLHGQGDSMPAGFHAGKLLLDCLPLLGWAACSGWNSLSQWLI